MAKKRPDFTSAISSKVSMLEKIKGKHGEVKDLPIDKIKPPVFHDRTVVNKEAIESLAENIQARGLISPIVVRKLPDGSYERMVGYRRIEAHKLLKKKTIKAIVLEGVSDEEAVAIMISENSQRENLNPYDEVLAHVRLFSLKFFGTPDETDKTIKRLYGIQNYITGSLKHTEEREEEYKSAIEIFNSIGLFNSFRSFINKLKLLKIRQDLIDMVRSNKLPYTIALKLNAASESMDEESFKRLLGEVLSSGASLREVEQMIRKYSTGKKEGVMALSHFLGNLKKRYKKLPKEKREEVDRKISEITKIMEEE